MIDCRVIKNNGVEWRSKIHKADQINGVRLQGYDDDDDVDTGGM